MGAELNEEPILLYLWKNELLIDVSITVHPVLTSVKTIPVLANTGTQDTVRRTVVATAVRIMTMRITLAGQELIDITRVMIALKYLTTVTDRAQVSRIEPLFPEIVIWKTETVDIQIMVEVRAEMQLTGTTPIIVTEIIGIVIAVSAEIEIAMITLTETGIIPEISLAVVRGIGTGSEIVNVNDLDQETIGVVPVATVIPQTAVERLNLAISARLSWSSLLT